MMLPRLLSMNVLKFHFRLDWQKEKSIKKKKHILIFLLLPLRIFQFLYLFELPETKQFHILLREYIVPVWIERPIEI